MPVSRPASRCVGGGLENGACGGLISSGTPLHLTEFLGLASWRLAEFGPLIR